MTDPTVEETAFYNISKKAIITLENLVNNNQISNPVKTQELMDICVGALVDCEVNDRLEIIDVFKETPQLLYDTVEFSKAGEYNLHDVLSQIICYRTIGLMQEFLDYINVKYEKLEESKYFEQPDN
jgi:hypothetical protein